MSLTSLIASDRETRVQLDRLIPLGEKNLRAPIRVPHQSGHHPGLLGTAFDYAVRIHLLRLSPNAKDQGWIAEKAVDMQAESSARREAHILKMGGDPARSTLLRFSRDLEARMRLRARNARVFARKHVHRRVVDRAWMSRLARHALRLAPLDSLFRSGYSGPEWFRKIDDTAVREIVEMLSILPPDLHGAEPLLLNPAFGAAAEKVGGADADLIVGDRLVDLKTTQRAHADRRIVRQMIGYVILADAARRGGEEMPEINEAVVYFARHGVSWRFPATSVYQHPAYREVADFLLARSAELSQRPRGAVDGESRYHCRAHGFQWAIVERDEAAETASLTVSGRTLVDVRWRGKLLVNRQEIIDAICRKLGVPGRHAWDVEAWLQAVLNLDPFAEVKAMRGGSDVVEVRVPGARSR